MDDSTMVNIKRHRDNSWSSFIDSIASSAFDKIIFFKSYTHCPNGIFAHDSEACDYTEQINGNEPKILIVYSTSGGEVDQVLQDQNLSEVEHASEFLKNKGVIVSLSWKDKNNNPANHPTWLKKLIEQGIYPAGKYDAEQHCLILSSGSKIYLSLDQK